jgi:hypothetical protein
MSRRIMIILEGGGRFFSSVWLLTFFAAVRGENGMEKPLLNFLCLCRNTFAHFLLRDDGQSLCIAMGVHEWNLKEWEFSLVRDGSHRTYGHLGN